MIRRHVWVAGRVQGVWYRQSCARQAGESGVGGWVRNLSDGRVEAVFEGSPAAVEAMLAWCRIGPPHARVVDVEVQVEHPEGITAFAVLR